MDSTVTVLAAGSKRATMVTSLRWPPALVSLPNALSCVALSTNGAGVRADQQEIERLAGCGRRCDQVLGVDLLDLVEAVVGVDVEAAGTHGGARTMTTDSAYRERRRQRCRCFCSFFRDLRSSAWRSARDSGATRDGIRVGVERLGVSGSSGVKNQKIPGRTVR